MNHPSFANTPLNGRLLAERSLQDGIPSTQQAQDRTFRGKLL